MKEKNIQCSSAIGADKLNYLLASENFYEKKTNWLNNSTGVCKKGIESQSQAVCRDKVPTEGEDLKKR